jgi:hypothetical protein
MTSTYHLYAPFNMGTFLLDRVCTKHVVQDYIVNIITINKINNWRDLTVLSNSTVKHVFPSIIDKGNYSRSLHKAKKLDAPNSI